MADATAEGKILSVTAQTSTTAAASFTSVERGTSSAPYDLSMHDLSGNTTTRNTANCYVVNAPGWYKIPLVYGNGIKNGINNTSAYNSSTFVDYKGVRITNLPTTYASGPYIKNSGTPTTAAYMWQDAQYLLQSLSYDNADMGYLKFYVSPTYIKEGNALIAIKDNTGTIMWSWHIWVSALDLDQTLALTTYDNSRIYDFMLVNLGWCNIGNITTYQKRDVKVKIKQAVGEVSTIITISQNPYNYASTAGNNTFYEWGRKDPMCPSSGIDNSFKQLYNSSYDEELGTPTLQMTIQNPYRYYYGTKYNESWIWYNTGYYDIWNAGNTTWFDVDFNYTTNKTVYDPCPVGFKVPPSFAFTGLASSDVDVKAQISHDSNSRYVSGAWSRGVYFWTNDQHTEKIFIPAIGYHHYTQASIVYGDENEESVGRDRVHSLYVVSVPQREGCDAYRHVSIYSTTMTLYGSAATSWGGSVRPIKD